MIFDSNIFKRIVLLIACLSIILQFNEPLLYAQKLEYRPVSTFSIVARDSAAGELGIAVASRFFSVGSVVPWARANVGAVATQASANTSFGWRGLDLLEKGATPQRSKRNFIEK